MKALQLVLVGALLCFVVGAVDETFEVLGASNFGIVDFSINLLYLPSLMSTIGLNNLEIAIQTFLAIKLDSYPISLCDLQVAIDSQSLDGRKIIGENGTDYVVRTEAQVFVCYHLLDESLVWDTSDIESRIWSSFVESETDLRTILLAMDDSFFDSVRFIEFISPLSRDDDSEAQEESTGFFLGLSFQSLIIFLVVGIGIFNTAVILLVPMCCSRRTVKQGSALDTEMSSCATDDITAHPPAPVQPPESFRQTAQHYIIPDTSPRRGNARSWQADQSSSSTSTDLSPSLSALRAQKHCAENRVREQLSGIIRYPASDNVEQGNNVDENPLVYGSTVQKNGKALHATTREHPIPPLRESTHRDFEKIEEMQGLVSSKFPEQRKTRVIPEESYKATFLETPNAPMEMICHTNDHDGCSVSTMTGGLSSFPNEERGNICDLECPDHPSTASCTEENESMSFPAAFEADDFGSIADSVPAAFSIQNQMNEIS